MQDFYLVLVVDVWQWTVSFKALEGEFLKPQFKLNKRKQTNLKAFLIPLHIDFSYWSGIKGVWTWKVGNIKKYTVCVYACIISNEILILSASTIPVLSPTISPSSCSPQAEIVRSLITHRASRVLRRLSRNHFPPRPAPELPFKKHNGCLAFQEYDIQIN